MPIRLSQGRAAFLFAGMGSDAHGKQELPVQLLREARLFCDLPAQAVRIGELQHVAQLIDDGTLTLTAVGDVLTGQTEGRHSEQDITVSDSSGIALQDLQTVRRRDGGTASPKPNVHHDAHMHQRCIYRMEPARIEYTDHDFQAREHT
jgi:hypothetical protein